MGKKLVVMLMVVLFVFSHTISVAGAESQALSLEQRINGLVLSPQPVPDRINNSLYWQYYDFTRAERIAADSSLSNYEKLQAVFLDVAHHLEVGGATACTFHQSVLSRALETVGFRVHSVTGMCRTKDGKALQGTYGYPKGWTGHSWIAVETGGTPSNIVKWDPITDSLPNPAGPRDILLGYQMEMDDIGGELLYFDTNLYATYGMDFAQCFAVDPADATWLKSAYLVPGF